MTGTETQIKQKINQYIKKWIPILGLEHWEIESAFDETLHIAVAQAKPEYFALRVSFNLAKIRQFVGMDILEKLVLHELCHALTWQLANWHNDGQEDSKYVSYLEEMTTTSIENAIWKASGRKLIHV